MRCRAAAWAALGSMTLLAWQALTVHYNYGGNWTALFCTGAKRAAPPQLAGENIYLFPGVNGYDGQYYHYIAHDPLLRRGLAEYIDEPRNRYTRILVPGLAFALAGGRAAWVDASYRAVILLCSFAGAYWLGRIAQRQGRSPAWGIMFFFLPATIVSADRMTIDVALAALCAGFAWYANAKGREMAIYGILVLAGLVRDTGSLLIAAYCLWLLLQHKLGPAIGFSTAVIPAVFWRLFVRSRTVPFDATGIFGIPLDGVLARLVHPMQYPFPPIISAVAQDLDGLALAGAVLAFGLMLPAVRRSRWDAAGLAMFLFTLPCLLLGRPSWAEAYAFGRYVTPLLLLLGIDALASREWLGLLPLGMIAPRLGLQLGSQILGVVRGLSGGV